MKIVVPVKQVAALDEDFELEPGARRVDPDALDWDLNEWDRFSVEAALQLVEESGGEVVVVAVGGKEAEDGLLACLAMGADRGSWVDVQDLDLSDPLLAARILAAVIGREEADLVLCGAQSSDAVNGATGIALAAHLDLPHLAVITKLSYDDSSGTATVERELEGGVVEILRAPCPALFTVQTGINEPRYATLRAIKQAREKPLHRHGLEELELDRDAVVGASGASLRALARPVATNNAEILDGSPQEVARRISEIASERLGR